jgi:ribose 5-phosphate isomerase B
MQVIIGSDHRGFELKEKLKETLLQKGFLVIDKSESTINPTDDYPDIAAIVGKQVSTDSESRGIVLCGSGVGVDIAANKIDGIRCGLAFNVDQIKSARQDDNINVLAIAADYIIAEDAHELVTTFLETKYEASESHQRRIDKITALE